MGLTVKLIGRDSEAFGAIQGLVEKMTVSIGRQVPVETPFELGRIADVVGETGEKLGSYDQLHLLREYAVHMEFTGSPPPEPLRTGFGTAYPLLEDVYANRTSTRRFRHLVNHADNGGYYFPIGFPSPVVLENVPDIESSVGSSVGLLAELEEVNLHLKMPEGYPEPGTLLFADLVERDPWNLEKYAWGVLHWFARKSVVHRLLLAFC
jgi:hypothetical protein